MDIDSLESAINSAKDASTDVSKDSEKRIEMGRDEEVGFHKGALNTLGAERAELLKMLQNVEAIAGAHLGRLKELGAEVK